MIKTVLLQPFLTPKTDYYLPDTVKLLTRYDRKMAIKFPKLTVIES
ncbi:hypothetical protein D051_1350 [Vibrio parahaemolyticus VPCR-2010]|nr:hypothetical protein Vp2S01_A0166 [Vibrio parahaemolyticus]EQM51161.1 hypothetical protein D051_1350 [Vibrio parahaemolyticus VPCR-2010]